MTQVLASLQKDIIIKEIQLPVFLTDTNACGRHKGLMVRVLDSGSNGSGLSLGWGTALCSWTLTVPLSTKEYNWVNANLLGTA